MAVPARRVIAFVVWGPIRRDDIAGLSDRVCELFTANQGSLVYCDVVDVEPDAVTVDALARLQLAARLNRCQVRLRNSSAELLELVAFMGLSDVLPVEKPDQVPRPAKKRARRGT